MRKSDIYIGIIVMLVNNEISVSVKYISNMCVQCGVYAELLSKSIRLWNKHNSYILYIRNQWLTNVLVATYRRVCIAIVVITHAQICTSHKVRICV